jgi:hypothetical protein
LPIKFVVTNFEFSDESHNSNDNEDEPVMEWLDSQTFKENNVFGTFAELELLREKNLELQSELEKFRYKEKHTIFLRKVSIVDTKRIEYVWRFLPAFNWGFFWYFTCRGSEFANMYFWILRDFFWGVREYSSAYYFGTLFGGIAIVWSFFQYMKAFSWRNFGEQWHCVSRFLWLIGKCICHYSFELWNDIICSDNFE